MVAVCWAAVGDPKARQADRAGEIGTAVAAACAKDAAAWLTLGTAAAGITSGVDAGGDRERLDVAGEKTTREHEDESETLHHDFSRFSSTRRRMTSAIGMPSRADSLRSHASVGFGNRTSIGTMWTRYRTDIALSTGALT
jgi:hypothetical protein